MLKRNAVSVIIGSVHVLFLVESILSVADLGFPVGGGGADPLGGADLWCIHFSAKMYAKMKKMDPVGGGGARAGGAPLDSPMIIFVVW